MCVCVRGMYSAVILPFSILIYFHVLFKLQVNFFRANSPNNQSLIYRLLKIQFPLFCLCMYYLISLRDNLRIFLTNLYKGAPIFSIIIFEVFNISWILLIFEHFKNFDSSL